MADGDQPKKFGCMQLGMIVGGALIVLWAIGAMIGGSEDGGTASIADVGQPSQFASASAPNDQPASTLTGPQSNAVRSAEQYLSMSGFSRKGLIQQLSSSAGEGYEVSDATVAVDSLNVNWDEQAARTAKQYLEMSGFSCKGLIQQLSSSAGEDYTTEQATYGAKQAGAC